jgi:tetratricopeptide (TPR) repeat protein
MSYFLSTSPRNDVIPIFQAIDYFQRVLTLQEDNGEVWSALGTSCFRPIQIPVITSFVTKGHCYLMQDDLQKAYSAYQQALYLLPNPKVSCLLMIRQPISHMHFIGGSKAMVRYRHSL